MSSSCLPSLITLPSPSSCHPPPNILHISPSMFLLQPLPESQPARWALGFAKSLPVAWWWISLVIFVVFIWLSQSSVIGLSQQAIHPVMRCMRANDLMSLLKNGKDHRRPSLWLQFYILRDLIFYFPQRCSLARVGCLKSECLSMTKI